LVTVRNYKENPIHPTEKEQYVACPAAYEFHRVLGLAPDFESWWKLRGTIFHKAICQDIAAFHDVARDVIESAGEIRRHGFPMDDEFLKKQLAELLMQVSYYKSYVENNNITVVGREILLDYSVMVGVGEARTSIPHRCTIDALTVHPDTPSGYFEIHDYKTGNKWPDHALNRKVQFGDYYLVKDLLRSGEDAKFLYPLRISEDDFPYIEDYTTRVIRGMEAGVFPYNNYGPNSGCSPCEYHDSCPRFEIGFERGYE